MLDDCGLGHHIERNDPAGGNGAIMIASWHPLRPGAVTLDAPGHQARWIHVTVEVGPRRVPHPDGSRPATRPIKLAFRDAILEHEPVLRERPTIITGDFNTGRPFVDEVGATLHGADRFDIMLERAGPKRSATSTATYPAQRGRTPATTAVSASTTPSPPQGLPKP